MPRRDDLHKILIIGSGPIVIGQACEFDYSGTQACKVLLEEGYEVVLVNSQPGHDHDRSRLRRPHLHRAARPRQRSRRIIEVERPDALLPTLGGQTALNLAVALTEAGMLEKYGVELIGADDAAIHRAEDRDEFRTAMDEIGLRVPRQLLAETMAEAEAACDGARPPAHHPPGFTLGGSGGGIAYDHESFGASCEQGLDARPISPGAARGVRHRLEGVRARGHARPRRQRRHRLLHREHRPDGRAHRRLHHRRAGADAHRPAVPAAARRLAWPSSARSAWRPAAPTSSSPSTPRPTRWWSSR